MKYFITEIERKQVQSYGTCYFEFQMGKHRNKFWDINSWCLHADLWEEYCLTELISQVIPEFDYFGVTYITASDWNSICNIAKESSKHKTIIEELSQWTAKNFEKYGMFSILGI